MKRYVFAAYKEYNANTKDNYVGDCVKRSLSIAYGLDYDVVSRELNEIKRSLGAPAFNVRQVYDNFISRHSGVRYGRASGWNLPKNCTVQQFAEIHPVGTYLVVCGKSAQTPNHMVCVLDGDIWDSWDSSNEIVHGIYCISESASTTISDFTVDDVREEIFEHVQSCLNKSKSKMPWADFSLRDPVRLDDYTIQQRIYCNIHVGDLIDAINKALSCSYTYTIKLNPRMSLEENLRSLKEKLWFKIREWAYAVRKDIEEYLIWRSLETHPDFSGSKDILVKLPEWCRSRIHYIVDNGPSSDYGSRYAVYMDALEGDPRASALPEVEFYSGTVTELKSDLQRYKTNYSRVGYDY